MPRHFFALILCASVLAAAPGVDFNRQVRPILSDTCLHCHGPDSATRMANLRLDTEEGARAVITPGKSAESELIARAAHQKRPLRMPPPTSGLMLTNQQASRVSR